MSEIVFNSALAPYMYAYMKEYATKGFNSWRHAYPLMRFDRYLVENTTRTILKSPSIING